MDTLQEQIEQCQIPSLLLFEGGLDMLVSNI